MPCIFDRKWWNILSPCAGLLFSYFSTPVSPSGAAAPPPSGLLGFVLSSLCWYSCSSSFTCLSLIADELLFEVSSQTDMKYGVNCRRDDRLESDWKFWQTSWGRGVTSCSKSAMLCCGKVGVSMVITSSSLPSISAVAAGEWRRPTAPPEKEI